MNPAYLVANLLAMSDWIDSDEQSQILRQAATALEAARLTDEERKAIGVAAKAYADNDGDDSCAGIAAALFGLLKRTRP